MKTIIFDFNRTLYDPESKKLITGAKKILKKLAKKYQLYLITTDNNKQLDLINNLGIASLFKQIIFTKEKTPQDFITCCVDSKTLPQEVIVIGDRVKSEIRIGNRLDMFTIQFKLGLFANELPSNKLERPKRIINKLKDLEFLMTGR